MQDQINFLHKYDVLKKLPAHLLEAIANKMVEKTYQPGEDILKINEQVDALYFIKEGQVDIFGEGYRKPKRDVLSRLGEEEIFGEQSLDLTAQATANVVAHDQVILYVIDRDSIAELEMLDQKIIKAIFSLSLSSTARKIRRANAAYVKLLEKKIALGHFLVAVIFILLPAGFITAGLTDMNRMDGTSALNSILAEIFALGLFAFAVKVSKLDYKSLGITWKGAFNSIKFGFLYTVPFMVLTVLIKYFFIKFHLVEPQPLFSLTPAFDPANTFGFSEKTFLAILLGLYVFSVLFQELIVRAGFQAPLMILLGGHYRNLLAILLPNIFFAMIHIPISITFAVIVFFPGLLWGWLLYKYKNILAPLTSHLLLGYFALFVLGVQNIFK